MAGIDGRPAKAQQTARFLTDLMLKVNTLPRPFQPSGVLGPSFFLFPSSSFPLLLVSLSLPRFVIVPC